MKEHAAALCSCSHPHSHRMPATSSSLSRCVNQWHLNLPSNTATRTPGSAATQHACHRSSHVDGRITCARSWPARLWFTPSAKVYNHLVVLAVREFRYTDASHVTTMRFGCALQHNNGLSQSAMQRTKSGIYFIDKKNCRLHS